MAWPALSPFPTTHRVPSRGWLGRGRGPARPKQRTRGRVGERDGKAATEESVRAPLASPLIGAPLAQHVAAVLDAGEHLLDLRVADRPGAFVDHQVLFGDIGDIGGFRVFGEQVVERPIRNFAVLIGMQRRRLRAGLERFVSVQRIAWRRRPGKFPVTRLTIVTYALFRPFGPR